MAAPIAPYGAVPPERSGRHALVGGTPALRGASRPRRRLAVAPVLRAPWPVAAAPDVEPPTTAVRHGAAPPATDVIGAPRHLIVMRPVEGGGRGGGGTAPPHRGAVRHRHVPGTPMRSDRPAWGPPHPAS